ncbi:MULTISPECIES: hypothetical protein [unclassified Cellulophaga]|uniref:hypothetical protein n=1 Tax=unclassified Cellulophaga TaxID=2634405 RepID=UPI0026E28DAC|nr:MULTISPECIES: hypothetical protein [unclassified Cellulophaga]MDO6492885.1 hypothetical protein [Cellulophaga sp. 2_MG-2023]MDO6496387.1 hypothetical protein [Cellulophaga sp. 3_MG-2023]
MKKLNYKQVSMLLYGIALITPMFFGTWTIGVFGLIMGWLGIFALEPFVAIPWIANFLYFGNLIFNKLNLKTKIGISGLTIIFALFVIGLCELPENEGGRNSDIVVGIGFLIWISSFVVLLIGQLKEKIKTLGNNG